MKNRKGFTVIELIVVVMIVLILASMIFSKAGCTAYYSQGQTGVYQCVKTYVMTMSEGESSKRVDLRPSHGGMVETMRVDDDVMMGQYNSATIYAQLEPGKWYNVTATGFRREGVMPLFPNITNVAEVPDPTR